MLDRSIILQGRNKVQLFKNIYTRTGKSIAFPKYQCPECKRQYTSLQGYADKKTIRLDNTGYINIEPHHDDIRYEEYLQKPHPIVPGSRCYVYGTTKETVCRCCHSVWLVRRNIQFKTKKKKLASYQTKYCKGCDVHYIDCASYKNHSDDWILMNPEELPRIEEELRIRREEKEKRKAEKKAKKEAAKAAEAQKRKEEILRRQLEQEKRQKEKIEAERIARERWVQRQKEQHTKQRSPDKNVHEHDNNIRVKDFVVRRTTFKCRHNDHKLQNIDGIISIIDRNGEVRQMRVSAGYCPNCNIFFIMESTYQNLKSKGTPICRVSDEKAYLSNASFVNGMQLAQESVLKQYGYSVSQEEGLTSARRRKILALLVDNKILTRNDIISYLDFFINQRKYQPKFEKAIDKWESDRVFISGYKAGNYTQYGVGAIHRKY